MLLTSVTFMPHFSSQQGSILGWANYYHFMAETYAMAQLSVVIAGPSDGDCNLADGIASPS